MQPQDGRVVLLLSTDKKAEPRTLVEGNDLPKSPAMFGLTVDGLKPGQDAVIDGGVFGWPVSSLKGLKAGDYSVQAVLNRYETFHRADGVTVKLPPDKGEGQQWNKKPGNFYSKPVTVHYDPSKPVTVKIVMDQEIAPIAAKPDTAFIKHVTIKSEMLSKSGAGPCI